MLAAVVQYKTPTNRPRKGLVTNWLAGLQPPVESVAAVAAAGEGGGVGDGDGLAKGAAAGGAGIGEGEKPLAGAGGAWLGREDGHCKAAMEDRTAAAATAGGGSGVGEVPHVPVWVEPGALRMPADLQVPLIMVGPGTGVAPFRSFLWQRAAINQQQQMQTQELGEQQQWQQGAGMYAQQHSQQQQWPGHVLGSEADHGSSNGFSQQQHHQQQQPGGAGNLPGNPAACYLFFGCRGSQQDFYYAQEWQQLQQMGVLDPEHGLVTAFSRERDVGDGQGDKGVGSVGVIAEFAAAGAGGRVEVGNVNGTSSSSSKKVYVTHRIRECGEWLWPLLSQRGAVVYVSGSAEKMPADVLAALQDVVTEHGRVGSEAAAQYVRQLELRGRYLVEAWS